MIAMDRIQNSADSAYFELFLAPPFGLTIPLSGLSDVTRILPDFLEGYPEIDSVLSHSALAGLFSILCPQRKKITT
jgi:hypothetical protein